MPAEATSSQFFSARYAVEDFDDNATGLWRVTLLFVLLGLFLGFGQLQGGDNLGHLAFTLPVAAAFLLVPRLELLRRSTLLAVTVSYLGLVGLEYYTLGLPAPLLPGMTVDEPGRLSARYVGRGSALVLFVNLASPWVYLGCKVAVGLLLGQLWVLRAKVAAQPEQDLRAVLGEERWRQLSEG